MVVTGKIYDARALEFLGYVDSLGPFGHSRERGECVRGDKKVHPHLRGHGAQYVGESTDKEGNSTE